MSWYDPTSWFKTQKEPALQGTITPAGKSYMESLLSGAYSASVGNPFLQALVRRTKPTADITSSQMSLAEYLKGYSPQPQYSPEALGTPSYSPYTPPAGTTPPSPIISAMEERIKPPAGGGAKEEAEEVVKEEDKKVAKELPYTPRWEAGGEVVTKQGVYQRERTEQGGSRMEYERELRPGDIFNNEEIYTHRKEWRPLSTEYLTGKGKMYFAPPKILSKLKERTEA